MEIIDDIKLRLPFLFTNKLIVISVLVIVFIGTCVYNTPSPYDAIEMSKNGKMVDTKKLADTKKETKIVILKKEELKNIKHFPKDLFEKLPKNIKFVLNYNNNQIKLELCDIYEPEILEGLFKLLPPTCKGEPSYQEDINLSDKKPATANVKIGNSYFYVKLEDSIMNKVKKNGMNGIKLTFHRQLQLF